MPSRVARRDGGKRHVVEKVAGRHGVTFLLVFSALLPAIAAYGILYRQGLSVPYQDDYTAILAFAADYDQLPTRKAKVLDIATTQFNEYKLGFEHSIVAAELELTHHLDFAFLTALGDLFLLPIAYLLWRTYQVEAADFDRRLLAFLPISLIFFSLAYWQNLNWAMTGLQNTPVILFGLLAIYFLASGNRLRSGRASLLLSCVAAALAAFSSANGFLLAPVGLLILLPRHAYARSLVWCASFAAPFAAYVYHYNRPVEAMGRAFYTSRPLFFLGFFGCVIPSRWPAAFLGFMMLTIFALAVRSRFDRTNPAAFYFAVWILETGFLVAWVRGAAGFTIASRYSMYSNLLLIFCYSFLAHYLPRRWPGFNRRLFYTTAVVFAVGLCLMADVSAYRKLGSRRRMVLSGIEFYRTQPEVNSPMIDPMVETSFPKEKAMEQAVLNNAVQKHLYTLPPKQEIR